MAFLATHTHPSLTTGQPWGGTILIPKGDEREAVNSLPLTSLYGVKNSLCLVGLRSHPRDQIDPFQAALTGKPDSEWWAGLVPADNLIC